MAANPNPGRITDASWYFMGELVAMEPGTQNSGIYADKPGYHGTRAQNDARSGVAGDYSCKSTLDRQGPSDKAAGYDWTFRSAEAGDYRQMAKIGDRLEAAFNARDPRLRGWREALGQTDTDKTAEGLDFQGWYRRTPDDSHEWHFHLSELRAFVESFINKEAMLSVLRGETLAAYLARGGQLIGDDMDQADKNMATATTYRTEATLQHKKSADYEIVLPSGRKEKRSEPNKLGAAVDAIAADVKALLERPPVELTDADLDALAVKVAALIGRLPTVEEIAAAIGRQDAAGLRAQANMVDAPPA